MLRDSRDIIRRLNADGFVLVSVRGSHHKFRQPAGTVRSIYAQANWRKD
jgi:predicted RNA binding protein YcfA (HicA-like mRNA interferase family)